MKSLDLNLYFILTVTSDVKNNLFPIILLSLLSFYYISNKHIRVVYIFSALLTLFVRTPPFLDIKENFSENDMFENNFLEIKKEVNNLLKKTNNGLDIDFTKDSFDKKVNSYIGQDTEGDKGWRVFPIRLAYKNIDSAKNIFPKLTEILDKCPNVSSCLVSILDGKTYIPIHNGYYKGFVRYMLPITVPEEPNNEVFLCNNYQKYNWKEGKGVLWDDLYPHKVYNNTSQRRIVLYMDVLRKLPEPLNTLNKNLINLISNSKMIKDEVEKTEKKYKL